MLPAGSVTVSVGVCSPVVLAVTTIFLKSVLLHSRMNMEALSCLVRKSFSGNFGPRRFVAPLY